MPSPRRARPVVRSSQPRVERLEPRDVPSVSPVYYSYDGSHNNLTHPEWGSTGTALLRAAGFAYADGVSAPNGAARPNARAVSNVLGLQLVDPEPNARSVSDMIYAWGQFIDHDIDRTPGGDRGSPGINITVPAGDPVFPEGTVLPLSRAVSVAGTGTAAGNPLQHPNTITTFLDGSMVYGSDAATAAALRTFVGGRLATSAGGLLPINVTGRLVENQTHQFPDTELYLAGDVRANENSELTSLQVLFVREHNRLAAGFAAAHPDWSDERLYQSARQVVVAELQRITYAEFLPALLGSGAPDAYAGYDAAVNPGVTAEFSVAAYRVGHSQVNGNIDFFFDDGSESHDPLDFNLSASNPGVLREAGAGVDEILKYLVADNAQEVDGHMEDGLRNQLFAAANAAFGGFDLYAIDVQRGRDLGLPDYNTVRAAYGLPRVTSFDQISGDPTVVDQLRQVYGTTGGRDNVDDLDLFAAGLAEDHVPGGGMGATFTAIIADQFARLRAGDRLWYQNTFTGDDLAGIEATTLTDVIARNTNVTNLQRDGFFFTTGTVAGVVRAGGTAAAGAAVELVDDSGTVVGSTFTAADGSYRFDTGTQGVGFSVRVLPPVGYRKPATADATLVDNGGAARFRVDFDLAAFVPVTAVGAAAGSAPRVTVTTADGSVNASFLAFGAAFTGGVSVAVGDVNGDGVADVVVAAGAGGGPHVKVIDGTKLGRVDANGVILDSALLANFFAFDPAFRGGVSVAVGHLEAGDGLDVVVGAGAGGAPHVRTFRVGNGTAAQLAGPLGSFFAFDAAFRGGVSVAVGQVLADPSGLAQVVTGAGFGGAPHVQAWRADGTLGATFMAYDPVFAGGVNVAVGAADAAGRQPVLTGAGPGGGPEVRAFAGDALALTESFLAGDAAFRGGVRVAGGRANGKPAVLAALGAGGTGRLFDLASHAALDGTALPGGLSVGIG